MHSKVVIDHVSVDALYNIKYNMHFNITEGQLIVET